MLKLTSVDDKGAEPLAEALRACRTHFVWAAVFSALVNILYLTPTLYMMQVYDRVVPTGGLTTLVLISVAAVFALASLGLLDWLRQRLLLRAGLRLDRMLSPRILSRALGVQGRTLNSQVLREFDSVRSALSGAGALALFDAPWTPLYLACCFLLHPAIGVLTLVGGAVLFALAWLNERDSRPRLARAMQSNTAAYAAQEGVARQTGQRRAAADAQADAQLTGGKYSGAIKFVRMTLQSVSLGLAAFLVVRGEISAGSIIASSVLLSRAVAPVEQLVGAWPNLVQARASWGHLVELFKQTAGQERARTALPAPRGRLRVEGATVRLVEGGPPQLSAASLSLEPGQTLGVVGASGSGKTTLARVVAGALAPASGAVRLDGADYDARDSDDLAAHIGYLPQVPSLFAGTIKDNISRFAAARGATPDQIDRDAVAAAQAAGAHEMILRLPLGYDTELGPFGQGVSAGQAQRIALARALYGDPALLVLDEPNSNLDQEGEAALMAAVLQAAQRGAAVVIVAHRAGILSRVDRLLVMADGAVQMEGPREEILARMRAGRPTPAAPVHKDAAS